MSCICDIPEVVICIKNTYPRMRYCPCCLTKLPDICTDDEGNILIVERIPSDAKKPAAKPMSMELDLDKINIDKEICLLAEHNGEAPWMTEYIKQSQRKQIIEYLKEKKKGD